MPRSGFGREEAREGEAAGPEEGDGSERPFAADPPSDPGAFEALHPAEPDGEPVAAAAQPNGAAEPPLPGLAASAPAPGERFEDEEDEERDDEEPSFFEDPGQITKTLLIVGVLVAAIYIFVPKLAGIEDAIAQLGNASRVWIGVALLATVAAFGSYVALFRGVVGERTLHLEWRESYQITMAGLAATRLFSAGGAGGIVLTYWALRKAGMPRSESARRMVAFLILLYAVYVLAMILFGILLRTGVLPGAAPFSLTVLPAAIAGGLILVIALASLIPTDLQRRLAQRNGDGRSARLAARLAALPATFSSGVRTAGDFIRHPQRGWMAMVGAVGFWAANVMILWASFKSLGVTIPFGEIVQGFFVGMAANLIPAPAGVGAVDGGLIGVFAIFGYSLSVVIAAVLIYRLIAFYLPVPPGIVAFFQLRRTVAGWEARRAGESSSGTPPPAAA
jgi:uncharacterized protein (TIRG00374 family)